MIEVKEKAKDIYIVEGSETRCIRPGELPCEEDNYKYATLGRKGRSTEAHIQIGTPDNNSISGLHADLAVHTKEGRWYIRAKTVVSEGKTTFTSATLQGTSLKKEWHPFFFRKANPCYLTLGDTTLEIWEGSPTKKEAPSLEGKSLDTRVLEKDERGFRQQQNALSSTFSKLEELLSLKEGGGEEICETLFEIFRVAFRAGFLEVKIKVGGKDYRKRSDRGKEMDLQKTRELLREDKKKGIYTGLLRTWPEEGGHVWLEPIIADQGGFTGFDNDLFNFLFSSCSRLLGKAGTLKGAAPADAPPATAGLIEQRFLACLQKRPPRTEGKQKGPDLLDHARVALLPWVCDAIRKGKTPQEIAGLLGVDPRTVKNYMEHIAELLGKEVAEAIQEGTLPDLGLEEETLRAYLAYLNAISGV